MREVVVLVGSSMSVSVRGSVRGQVGLVAGHVVGAEVVLGAANLPLKLTTLH